MTRIHRPGLARFVCWACGGPSDQRHHAVYPYPGRSPEFDERFCQFPLCDSCHSDVHRLWESLDRKVSLLLLSLWYIHNPVKAVQQVQQVLRPGQLSFADQIGPQGEAWRQWEKLFEEYEDLRREAA